MIFAEGPETDRLGRAFADEALRRGVHVVRPDGSLWPIPVLLSPVIVPKALLVQASHDARLLLDGLCRVTRQLMEQPNDLGNLVARLFGDFSELEAAGLRQTYRDAEQLATARVDYLLDESGQPRALEMNATIPAMQGYSDSVAEAWLRTVKQLGDADVDRILAKNGRNTDELLASLVAHHRHAGGRQGASLDLVIVARAGDAQRGELDHYVRRWTTLGHRVEVVTPDEIKLGSDGATVHGRKPDLFYRHIFARRLDPTSDFARMLLEPRRHRIFNPIASHLEVKGTLALLSEAAAEPQATMGLSDEIIAAVRRTVPWTRVLGTGPSTGPDHKPIADLAAWARIEGRRLVLKRSWDYGGKSVFLGADLDDDGTQARLRSVVGPGLGHTGQIRWADLVDHAVAASDAWVVQELVHARPQRHLRVDADAVRSVELYLDLSAYTNLGDAPAPTGGVVRASASRIVNILGGGGLAPLFTDEAIAV